MMRALVLLVWLAAGPVLAQTLPALHDVTGVAANDVLNLRAEPNATAAIVGALAPDARNIEIVAVDESAKWGLVGQGEGRGWAALRFLSRQGGSESGQAGDDSLPLPLACGGTEPFWSLKVAANGAVTFRPVDGAILTAPLSWSDRPVGRSGFAYGLTAAGGAITGIVERRACSDGMSDRPFGLSLFLIVTTAGQPALYDGCCSLSH